MDDTAVRAQLLERATNAGLQTERHPMLADGESRDFDYIVFPEGDSTRRVSVSSAHIARELNAVDFESYVFIGEYDAIADLKKGSIEAALSTREPLPFSILERRLGFANPLLDEGEAENSDSQEAALKAQRPDGTTLEISKSSRALNALAGRFSNRASLSLKIHIGSERDYASALDALETISNSIFFQIDLERDIALSLRRSFRARRRGMRRLPTADLDNRLSFPEFEYDEAPISLYWYAKSARGMPLLQFLAYYQVAEYYFPGFAKLEAIRTARKILKNPTFRIDRESDLTRLISSISGASRVGSTERDQMKATVLEVLSLDEVARFLAANEDTATALSKKNKLITDKTINVGRKDHDHRHDIAAMLYDIRCQIVHTKNETAGNRDEMLLPFSSAEEQLWPYIELMRLVAQNALIRSSSPLRTL